MDYQGLLETLNTSLAKSEFKDKLGRLVQYGCRGLSGFLVDTGAGSKDQLEQIKLCQSTFADARRLNRFFKELAIAPTIPREFDEPDQVNRTLMITSKVSLVLFFLFDHVGMLQKWKLVMKQGAPSETIKLAMKFFSLAHTANLLLHIKKLKEESDLEGTPQFNKAKKDAAMMNVIKSALLVLQGLHVSGTLETRDSLVGAAGVFTSYLDLQAMWPSMSARTKKD